MNNASENSYKLHIVLDNIRSAFNVGSIFRSADAVGNTHIYLCGITPEASHPKIHKTALGSTQSVPSTYHPDSLQLVKSLKEKGIPIFAIELGEDSEHFQKVDFPNEVALIFGHEIVGVNQFLLEIADKRIYIPMNGIKESLNVANTASILMYEAARGKI